MTQLYEICLIKQDKTLGNHCNTQFFLLFMTWLLEHAWSQFALETKPTDKPISTGFM